MQRIHKVLGEAERNAPSRHMLSAPAAGRVTGLCCRKGGAARAGEVLVVMQSEEKQ